MQWLTRSRRVNNKIALVILDRTVICIDGCEIMKEKGKSINSLMKHIRDNHHIKIGKGRTKDKRELLNMGYFHAYKAYKFVKNIEHPLLLSEFSEIKDIYDLDNSLKELFYPVVMKVETAINNYTIACVVTDGGTDLESIFEDKLNHYSDLNEGSRGYKKEMKSFLQLRKRMDDVIATNYTKSNVIQHYVHNNKAVPLWAIFELTTLGDLGAFVGRLNNVTREKLSKDIGIYDKRFDTTNLLLSKHLYIIKDLRNAVAHNNPIFDCRFRTGKISNVVINHLETNLGIKKINFKTITDYVLLVAYYMSCLQFTKKEVKTFIRKYEKIISDYQKKSNNSENYRKIFDVDGKSKIQKFKV